ncbi:MAG: hypothetical protein M1829_003555 [Trizodia sp. TS-e1964]|nr:MAG: hypothetical protein M1829_003555 [Trizodia sp. TS-e1964]
MHPDKHPSRSVFVGNIPYGLTEEQITHIFSTVGTVVSFRLVYDKETGRPKGFGFATYQDSDSAASAVRNLNDYEIMNRKLRVDYSNDGPDPDSVPGNYDMQYPQPLTSTNPAPASNSSLPPLPPGTDLPPNLTCPDAISRTLATLPPAQLLDILAQMKSMVMADPAKATELLKAAPQLSYAIFQALLLMGLVSTDILTSIVEQSTAGPVRPPVPTQPALAHQQASIYPTGYSSYGQTIGQIPGANLPAAGRAYQQPAAVAAPQTQQIDHNLLLQQILSLSPEVIDAMGPVEKAQVLEVRQKYGMGRIF